MTSEQADFPMGTSDHLVMAVEWLRSYPHSSAMQVAEGIHLGVRDERYVYGLLERAERDGWVQRMRMSARSRWLWEAVPLKSDPS
jgi:hypothetical protein